MVLIDVNVLVYAFQPEAQDHSLYRRWLLRTVESPEAYGVTDLVLSGFVRIVTNPNIFRPPSALGDSLEFAAQLRSQPNCVWIAPGPRHWEIFTRLCRQAGAKGNLVADAYLAALAIESGSEWISTDRDYARFPGLRWRHPLQ